MSGFNAKITNATKEEYDVLPSKSVVLECKRKIFRIVESMLEAKIAADKLIENCQMLSRSDYDDVIEERNIIELCGYPLCSNRIQIPRQMYRIVLKVNRVYSIKERKCFCSDKCYKASNFLKHQLFEAAVWLQDNPVVVKLLPDKENKGAIGEEVWLVPEISENVTEVEDEKHYWFTKEDEQLMHNEIKKCADGVKTLEIKESSEAAGEMVKAVEGIISQNTINVKSEASHVFSEGDKKCNETSECSDDYEHNNIKKNSNLSVDGPADTRSPVSAERIILPRVSSEEDQTASYEQNATEHDSGRDNYFLPKDSLNISEKLMPIFSKGIQQPILIEPISPPDPTVNSFLLASSPVSLGKIEAVLLGWITDASLKFVYGEACGHTDVESSERTSSVHDIGNRSVAELRALKRKPNDCTRTVEKSVECEQGLINKENCAQTEDDLYLQKVMRFFPGEDKIRKSVSEVKFKTGRNGNIKVIKNESPGKELAHKSSAKGKDNSRISSGGNSPMSNRTSESPYRLPMVDSLSQNNLRQQIVRNKLKIAFSDFLPLIGLNYRIVGDVVLQLVSTFRLTAVNILLKPNEWKLVAVVLFRMLLKGQLLKDETSEQLADESRFAAFVEKIPAIRNSSVYDIDKVIYRLLNPKAVN